MNIVSHSKFFAELSWCSHFDIMGAPFVHFQDPSPILDSFEIAYSPHCAQWIGGSKNFDFNDWSICGANARFDFHRPFCSVYAGHQFGQYVPQLGDGRAITLGTVANQAGQRIELQWKGSGLTPYSRMGDGRAVLRSSVREYLMSEHFHVLGVPTTRALSVVGGREQVYREELERTAIVLRAAPSFLRFGHLEYFFHRNELDHLRQLIDFIVEQYYPQFRLEKNRVQLLLNEIIQRTARLMAHWMSLAWVHGVMNTDNMSILGLTMDYGPFAFASDLDPNFCPNHSDHQGRYRLGRQGQIGYWNCQALAWTFSCFLGPRQIEDSLARYEGEFRDAFLTQLRAKIGFEIQPELLDRLLVILHKQRVDWTMFWWQWSKLPQGDFSSILKLCIDDRELKNWLCELELVHPFWDKVDWTMRCQRLLQINPRFVMRHHVAQEAIQAAHEQNIERFMQIQQRLLDPFNQELTGYNWDMPKEGEEEIHLSCSS